VSWYWWVLIGIMAVNAAAIALIALVMIADQVKKRRNAKEDQSK
jgi:hypothetical protein